MEIFHNEELKNCFTGITHTSKPKIRIYLEELGEHETAGHFDSIDLQSRSIKIHHGALTGVGS